MKLPKRTFQKKWEQQHGRCFYCGSLLSQVKIEVDHILCWNNHKDGTVNNLCLCCSSCNRLKSDLSLDEFKLLVAHSFPEKLIRGLFYYEFINIYPRGEKR